MLRIDFKEEQTLIQLCNGKIDEKTKHLHFVYTGVKNKGNQNLLLIRHPSCYVLAVIEERKHLCKK
jgi:hypothetical protein